MSRRLALGILAVASPLILATFFTSHPAARWLFTLLVLTFPVALIGLGTARDGERPRHRWLPILLLLLFLGCGMGILALSGRPASDGGLPPATAILLYGLGLLSLAVVVGSYVATFGRFGPTRPDLERLRRMKRDRGDPEPESR